MSIDPITSSAAPPRDEREPWQPGLSRKEAATFGVSKRSYAQLVTWAQLVADHHLSLGTPRQLWEGAATHNDQFVAQYVEAGERELADRLARGADPDLDEAQKLLEDSTAALDDADQYPLPVTTPESGATYSGAEAVDLVAKHNAEIEADYRAGKQHHRRVPPWVVTTGKWLPWVEGLGLLAFVAYFLDVPLLQPWRDWLGFTLGLTIVAVVIYGQTRLVHEGAEKHNVAREAAADGNRREAERAYGRRNLCAGLAAAVAAGITAGLILRGTAVLHSGAPAVIGLLVFLAVLTGLLMPLVSYLCVARDGSKVSRERDSVVADLDADLDAFVDLTRLCRDGLASMADIGHTLREKNLPDVCRSVQATVDEAHTPYTTARLIIGGLVADPPATTSPSVRWDGQGRIAGQIGTGVPGARTVDLGPLLDRIRRLGELDVRRMEIEQRLTDLRRHPWTRNGTTT